MNILTIITKIIVLFLTQVLELHDYPDLRGIACNPIDLSKFLHFPTSSDKYEVSHALCNVNDSMIPHLTEFLQSQFDIAEFIRLVSYFFKLCFCLLSKVIGISISTLWNFLVRFNNE